MIVGMWMTRDVVGIGSAETVTTAAALMASKRIRRLPVVTRDGDAMPLLGIVTASDLYRVYPPHVNPFSLVARDRFRSDVSVAEVMKSGPVTAAPNDPIERAARLLCDRKISGLPVVEHNALVGIITESDIFRAFTKMLQAPPGSARITFDARSGEDIFGLLHQLAAPRQVKVLSFIHTHFHEIPVCVVGVDGGELEAFLDEIWKSGHHVLNVLRIV